MKNDVLSIFIDESGSLTPIGDDLQKNLCYWDYFYIVTLVFHFQDNSIESTINQYEALKEHYRFSKNIHFGPLIRRENDFLKTFNTDETRKIFYYVSSIIEKTDIRWAAIVVDRRKLKNINDFNTQMASWFDSLTNNNRDFFHLPVR